MNNINEKLEKLTLSQDLKRIKDTIQRNIMGEIDKETIDLCRKIYRENKEAIDLIIENNDYKEDVVCAFNEILESSNFIKEIVVEKDGILALPSGVNNIQQYKYGNWADDMICYMHFISFSQGHKDACVELLFAPPKNENDKEKKNKLMAKVTEKTGLNFKYQDWNCTKAENLITYDECLEYNDYEKIKKHIKNKIFEIKNVYIDKFREALNEFCE